METDQELSETTQPRPRIGWRKCIAWGVLILAMLLALRVIGHRRQMAGKLQATLAAMDRNEPGWRLEDIEASREDVPEEENSARLVVAAGQRLPQPWPPPYFPDEPFQLLPPNERLNEEDFVRLSTGLASGRAALAMAGPLADMPRGRHRLHYERNPRATWLTDQQGSRLIVKLLVFESMRRNQQGESKEALTACRAALNAARSLGDEPICRSQLLRTAGVVFACQAIERTLGQGETTPEDLSALQKLLANEDAFPGLLTALRGERAVLNQAIEGMERGEVSLGELTRKQSNWLESAASSLWQMDTREDHILLLSLITRRIQAVQLPLHEQAPWEKRFEQEVEELPQAAVLARLLLPGVFPTGEAFRRKHALLRSTMVALAAERCRCEKKAWPDSADQLCPHYLACIPLDPFDGQPLRYRRVNDGVVIYSVGPDAVDDGGHLDRTNEPSPGMDIGFRLWDVAQRSQPAQPRDRPR